MTMVLIPQTTQRQPFRDTVTLVAEDGLPAISIIVKCYLAVDLWYMLTLRSDGSPLLPGKMLAETPNLWAPHAALLRSVYGRVIVCEVRGEPRTKGALYGQCSINLTALSPLDLALPDLT